MRQPQFLTGVDGFQRHLSLKSQQFSHGLDTCSPFCIQLRNMQLCRSVFVRPWKSRKSVAATVHTGHNGMDVAAAKIAYDIIWQVHNNGVKDGGPSYLSLPTFPFHCFPSTASPSVLPVLMPTATHTLHQWEPVTLEDVVKLIGNAPNNHCQLDPAPTWLVKQHSRLLAPFIALLINTSLASGCFPAQFKHAVVTPLIKKGSTDSSQLKSYRPVSNLPFLSKLLEKAVQTQLQRFLTLSDAMPKHQSAYRPFIPWHRDSAD